MCISLPTIEQSIRESLPDIPEIENILSGVRDAVSGHILRHSLQPRDLFQMRITTQGEHMQTPLSQQTHLIIHFGENPLESSYLDMLQRYYGRTIFLHLPLNHSIIL